MTPVPSRRQAAARRFQRNTACQAERSRSSSLKARARRIGNSLGVLLEQLGEGVQVKRLAGSRVLHRAGELVDELDLPPVPIDLGSDAVEFLSEHAGEALKVVARVRQLWSHRLEVFLDLHDRIQNRRLVLALGPARFEGGFHARDLDAQRLEPGCHRSVEPISVLDKSGLAELRELFDRGSFRVQASQRSGLVELGRFGIGDWRLLGLPHRLVERHRSFRLSVLSGLKPRPDAGERGVLEQAGVGPLQLLQELGRLLELTQLEHVADGRRGLVGIAQTCMAADAHEKQDCQQNGRGD